MKKKIYLIIMVVLLSFSVRAWFPEVMENKRRSFWTETCPQKEVYTFWSNTFSFIEPKIVYDCNLCDIMIKYVNNSMDYDYAPDKVRKCHRACWGEDLVFSEFVSGFFIENSCYCSEIGKNIQIKVKCLDNVRR